jgi:hypothetical protein
VIRRLPYRGRKVWGIIGGAPPGNQTGDQVTRVVNDEDQFHPSLVSFRPALPAKEVPADIPALQACAVDAGFGVLFDEAARPG